MLILDLWIFGSLNFNLLGSSGFSTGPATHTSAGNENWAESPPISRAHQPMLLTAAWMVGSGPELRALDFPLRKVQGRTVDSSEPMFLDLGCFPFLSKVLPSEHLRERAARRFQQLVAAVGLHYPCLWLRAGACRSAGQRCRRLKQWVLHAQSVSLMREAKGAKPKGRKYRFSHVLYMVVLCDSP